MARRRVPIGIQTFSTLREQDCYYVDRPRTSSGCSTRGRTTSDAHVRFTFLTGISKFSKVNLFSQLNNLTDITLDPVYSSICGYTEGDPDTVFAPELAGMDRERVREWYNGYGWRGAEKVYNPYDVLLLLRRWVASDGGAAVPERLPDDHGSRGKSGSAARCCIGWAFPTEKCARA